MRARAVRSSGADYPVSVYKGRLRVSFSYPLSDSLRRWCFRRGGCPFYTSHHHRCFEAPPPSPLTTPLKGVCGESTLFLLPFSSHTSLISCLLVALPARPPPRPAPLRTLCSPVLRARLLFFLGRTASPFHAYSCFFLASAAPVWCTGATTFFFVVFWNCGGGGGAGGGCATSTTPLILLPPSWCTHTHKKKHKNPSPFRRIHFCRSSSYTTNAHVERTRANALPVPLFTRCLGVCACAWASPLVLGLSRWHGVGLAVLLRCHSSLLLPS